MVLAVLAASFSLACAETMTEVPSPVEIKDAKNCYCLSTELYRSGQPGSRGFKALEKLGLKSVLNLREYHSDADEAEHTGLRLYRIVMQGWTPEKALEELMDERFGHHRSYYSNLAELVRTTDWKAFKEEFRKKRHAQGV